MIPHTDTSSSRFDGLLFTRRARSNEKRFTAEAEARRGAGVCTAPVHSSGASTRPLKVEQPGLFATCTPAEPRAGLLAKPNGQPYDK